MKAKVKSRAGRPKGTRNKSTKADPEKAKVLTAKGYTDKQLADFFGVKEQTINNWKKQFPIFFESLKTGKALADAKVEACLFQRAIGYSVPDVHISSYEGEITITPIIKHYPPDTTAQIFWLKNRQPKKWRDKTVTELEGEIQTSGVLCVPIGMSKDEWLQSAKKNQKQNREK